MRIVNIIRDGKITNQPYYDAFLSKIDEIKRYDDKKKENYTLERMDLFNHLSFDMLLSDDDEIMCFSGLYNRPSSKVVPGWPAGVYRLSNRTYIDRKFRTPTSTFLSTRFINPVQITKHKDDIKFAFISREHPKSRFYFKKLKQTIDYYDDWTIDDNLVQVVPNVEKQSSYQCIIYKSYGTESHGFKRITEEEWKHLPN